jgi:phosphoglycerate dehydrogenase-like enzyme
MPETIRVRSVYPFSDTDRAWLGALDPRVELVFGGEDSAAWSAALEDPGLEVLWSNYPPPNLDRVPRLRWLAMASAGVDTVTALDPWRLGITVTNGSGLHVVSMGEYVLAAALFASERIEARLARRVAHSWPSRDERALLTGRRLRGRTAAIIGYGSVGREVARLLDAFGVRVLALKADPSQRIDHGWREPGTGDPEGVIPARIVGPGSLGDIVAESDLVVLTLPATPRTRGVIGATVLGAMRADAWLVNVGRGALVDEAALVEALRAGGIGGAVLDVVSQEPLPPDHPLWDAPNCLITPHISGTGDPEALWHTTALYFAENLQRYLRGEGLFNRTSGAAGY